MAFQQVEVKGTLGLATDVNPKDLPPHVWTGGSGFNSDNGETTRVSGATELWPDEVLLEAPMFALAWNDGSNPTWLYGGDTKIHKISPSGNQQEMATGFNTQLVSSWQGDVFNGVAVMNNAVDAPVYTDSGTTMVPLIDWPVGQVAQVIRPFKNYLIALNIEDTVGGVDSPSMVHWSTPADLGSIPLSWDVADPAERSGKYELADTPGVILEGKALGDSFMVYKEDAVWALDFIGGNDVFSFRKVFNDAGVISKDCVVEFDGKHFVLTREDAYIHDGVQKKSLMTGVVSSYLDSIDITYYHRTQVVADHERHEILVYYVVSDTDNGLSNIALTWNWDTEVWSVRELTDVAHMSEGVIDTEVSNVWGEEVPPGSVVGDTGTWNSDTSRWNFQDGGLDQKRVMVCDYENSRFLQLNKGNTWAGVSYGTLLIRTGLDFDDDSTWKKVNAIYPHFKGDKGTVVNISVGKEDSPGSGAFRFDPVRPFVIGEDYKVNVRTSGRNIAIAIASTEDALWTLTGYQAEWMPTRGKR
tara:strand:- start:27605 stop:29185 length:1581 start_codon:yes stop_codon:yes gene_type:complete